jgi:hypothetical protein
VTLEGQPHVADPKVVAQVLGRFFKADAIPGDRSRMSSAARPDIAVPPEGGLRSPDGTASTEGSDRQPPHGGPRHCGDGRHGDQGAGPRRLRARGVTVLIGDEDANRIDSLGKVSGLWTRVWRMLQFTQTDQMVDLVVYEAALRDGRTVIAVHAPRADDRDRAKRALAAAGAHFMNFFGRLATEDISRWLGEELPIPRYLRR